MTVQRFEHSNKKVGKKTKDWVEVADEVVERRVESLERSRTERMGKECQDAGKSLLRKTAPERNTVPLRGSVSISCLK